MDTENDFGHCGSFQSSPVSDFDSFDSLMRMPSDDSIDAGGIMPAQGLMLSLKATSRKSPKKAMQAKKPKKPSIKKKLRNLKKAPIRKILKKKKTVISKKFPKLKKQELTPIQPPDGIHLVQSLEGNQDHFELREPLQSNPVPVVQREAVPQKRFLNDPSLTRLDGSQANWLQWLAMKEHCPAPEPLKDFGIQLSLNPAPAVQEAPRQQKVFPIEPGHRSTYGYVNLRELLSTDKFSTQNDAQMFSRRNPNEYPIDYKFPSPRGLQNELKIDPQRNLVPEQVSIFEEDTSAASTNKDYFQFNQFPRPEASRDMDSDIFMQNQDMPPPPPKVACKTKERKLQRGTKKYNASVKNKRQVAVKQKPALNLKKKPPIRKYKARKACGKKSREASNASMDRSWLSRWIWPEKNNANNS